MSTLSSIQRYANTQGIGALPARRAASSGLPTAASGSASTQVNISGAAREAAKNDESARSGMKLPDDVAAWFKQDFSPEIVAEARARLADIKANGPLGAEGPMNLPLLPENRQLADSFRQEMRSIHEAGFDNATPEQSARFNLLMNLSMRLQLVGWQKPMSEADVQREFDISNAMAKLAANDPAPPSAAPSEQEVEQMIADSRSGAVPAAWRQRWEDAGLAMPKAVTLAPGGSLWLEVGAAAGIGEDELMNTLRQLAENTRGSALTRALEGFISERYLALAEA